MTNKSAAEALQAEVLQLKIRLKVVEKQRNDALNREVIASASTAVLQEMQEQSARKIAGLEKRIADLQASTAAAESVNP